MYIARDRALELVPRLAPKGKSWLEIAIMELDGIGPLTLAARRDKRPEEYDPSEGAITIIRNRIVKTSARDLAKLGLFSMEVIADTYDPKTPIVQICHSASGLILRTDLSDQGASFLWYEARSPLEPIEWFSEVKRRKLRQFSILSDTKS